MEPSRRALLAAVPASAVAAGVGPRAVAGDDDADNDDAEDGWGPLGRVRVTGAAEAVVDGETVYVATADGFAVADVADPTDPELLAERRNLVVEGGELIADAGSERDPDGSGGDDTDGDDNADGLEGDDESDTNEDALEGDAVEESDGDDPPEDPDDDAADEPDGDDEPEPFTEILDLSVEGDRLVVPGPANPAEDVFHGFALYDVSEPTDPDPLVLHETDFHIHNTALHEGYCYLVGNDGERNSLVIVDVSDDEPSEVGRWSVLEEESRWEEADPFLWYLHDVTIAGDIAVLAYWNAGTYLVDVSDPAEPEYVGHVAETDVSDQVELSQAGIERARQTLPGNDHHSRLVGDLLAVGREAWAAEEGDPEGSGGIDLYDAADPDDIAHLATIEAPPTDDASFDGGEWTTAHNFSFQNDRLYASWYRGGVSIHDVSDPAEPVELARWEDRDRAAFWSTQTVGEIVVAPSTPLVPNAPTEGAVYTFPASLEGGGDAEAQADDGEEADTDEEVDEDDGERADENGEDADDELDDDPGEGADDGERTDAESDDEDEPAAETDGDANGGLPGFGIGAAIAGGAAAGGAAVLAWLRLRGSDGETGADPNHR